MFCGFTIGSALGGIIAAQILPGYGWRALLVGGGVAPLLLVPVLGGGAPGIRSLPRDEGRRR